jgi:hypothetical protein
MNSFVILFEISLIIVPTLNFIILYKIDFFKSLIYGFSKRQYNKDDLINKLKQTLQQLNFLKNYYRQIIQIDKVLFIEFFKKNSLFFLKILKIKLKEKNKK